MDDEFSCWYRWIERNQYLGITFPGVYILAISGEDLAGLAFGYRPEIVYVGMTNAVHGLRGRLIQFDNTIAMRHCQHGGADRVLYKHQDYLALSQKLFVALPFHVHAESDGAR